MVTETSLPIGSDNSKSKLTGRDRGHGKDPEADPQPMSKHYIMM